LFDPNLPPSDGADCEIGGACIRGDDGALFRLLLPGEVSEAGARLASALTELDGSIPETEWADRRSRNYVASRFNVCVHTYANVPDRVVPVTSELAVVLAAFPPRAAQLLGSREAQDGAMCFEITLDEARTLADEFLRPSGGGSQEYGGIVVRNPALEGIRTVASSEGIVAYVTFLALSPHGAPMAPFVG
jgi:hypothetical protein